MRDRAAVLSEVRSAFEQYEQALVRHDVEALNAFFLNAADSIRYGIAEQHYGYEAIAAGRRSAAPVHPQRRLLRTVVSSNALEKLHGLVIKPGMPAEMFIRTGERSLLNYLFKPLLDRAGSALTEE